MEKTKLDVLMKSATAKTTPVDADTIAIVDSADSSKLKKVTWANIKATLKAYFDTLYPAIKNESFQIQLVADDTDVASQIAYVRIPSNYNGTTLQRAIADVTTAGDTNATTIQVRNMTKYSSNDALSSAISIASGDTLATAGTVDASYDDVATNDLIKIYVTGVSTTAPKGLRVVLEYR